MKKNLLIILISIFTLLSVGLGVYCIKLNAKVEELESNNKITVNNTNNDEDVEKINLDCSFTQTYNIVNLMDGYIAEVPEYSYVIVDKFQMHDAIAHRLPSKLKENLKIRENYEFTYHIKGKMASSKVLDIYDVIGMIVEEHPDNDNLTATLQIKKTDKLGLGQIQEPICKTAK